MTTRDGRLVPADGKMLPGRAMGAVCGVLAAAGAIGIAQLLAGLSIPQASPVIAVGQAAIDLTPLPLKNWATSEFGTNDKNVLLTGVFVVLFLYAAVVGMVAVRRLSFGLIGLGIFAVIGLAAALSRPNASAAYALPTLGGALVGAFALYRLVVTAREGTAAAVSARAAAEPLPPIVFGDPAGVTGDRQPVGCGRRTCRARCTRRTCRAPTSRRCASPCGSRRPGARSWSRRASRCSPPRSARSPGAS